ncbi:MAG TPA: M56 family metallopeptidase, partial [Longimicrobium sp.]|nr:M56 family metallopeptidase [Longimicrobium sp.]
MIVSWMLYSLLVSALVAAAAWVLEEVCRLLGRPVRWVWIGAMGATLALVALAPLRTSAATSLAFDASVVRRSAPLAAEDGGTGVLAALTDAATAVRDLAGDTLREAATLGARIPGEALAGAWLALTAALLAVATGTLLRAGRERRRWPLREVAGTPVRVAPRVGPAVLGLRQPEVVVPRWLLEATPEEQRLVVLHEREHIRARDPLLLAAGCLGAALVPWNPAAWWMLRRLRTAVELDCDARVLRHGVRPAAYGTLLIDMAGRGPGLTLGAPALA